MMIENEIIIIIFCIRAYFPHLSCCVRTSLNCEWIGAGESLFAQRDMNNGNFNSTFTVSRAIAWISCVCVILIFSSPVENEFSIFWLQPLTALKPATAHSFIIEKHVLAPIILRMKLMFIMITSLIYEIYFRARIAL